MDGWEKYVRRITDMKYKVSISGSNSKMLSSEIASTLGGLFVIMKIYPYSFAKYLIANGKEKNIWIPLVQVIKPMSSKY
ncbi:MAG: AAA family ATPase [Lachnospiraceae bacterium]|nr:AAA family ATPase [Lachnospiraceae bacterium]MCI7595648.1 AAA family ATPase [Lachnospiraceae bacterium]MDY3223807.1 AAA family ATPase [Lachnospiraceae bacterium]